MEDIEYSPESSVEVDDPLLPDHYQDLENPSLPSSVGCRFIRSCEVVVICILLLILLAIAVFYFVLLVNRNPGFRPHSNFEVVNIARARDEIDGWWWSLRWFEFIGQEIWTIDWLMVRMYDEADKCYALLLLLPSLDLRRRW